MPKEPDQPVQSFGDWDIMPDCTLRNNKRRIIIYGDRLMEPDLLLTLHSDRVANNDWNDIMPAFFFACKLAGIVSINNFQTDFQ